MKSKLPTRSLRVGYSYWGFLGDYKLNDAGEEISAPDGNATYSWSIIWELLKRGHDVYAMQKDRDLPAYNKFGVSNFESFSKQKRAQAYQGLKQTHGREDNMPDLDILFLEWRWPIHGVNCICWSGDVCIFPDDNKYNGLELNFDLRRQYELLEYYKQKNTKIVIFDLDHKLTEHDEFLWKPDVIMETSSRPRLLTMDRVKVNIPFVMSDLLEHSTALSDYSRKLVYIGSRYERDEIITKWINPTANKFPGQVEFHGDWLSTQDECKKLWPNVSYNGRCTTKDFKRIYSTAVAVPLLAKQSYLDSGFVTARLWETVLFGTLPIGLADAFDIQRYTNFVAQNPEHMTQLVEELARMNVKQKNKARRQMAEKLEFMDAKYFVDEIEKAV